MQSNTEVAPVGSIVRMTSQYPDERNYIWVKQVNGYWIDEAV
jgi:hypothetical protein